ncbi:MAG: hypothetical protein QME42_03575 [bacterium]|nr:hypothetical protein [bacterium]
MRKKRSESGMTMIELAIAVLILLVGVLSVVNMFITGSLNVVTTGNANLAMNLCRQKLEEVKMRQADYNSLTAQPVSFPTVGTTTLGSCKGTWTITIEGINGSTEEVTATPAQGDYLRVTVSVVWMEAIEHKRRLFTYIGDIS